MNDISLPAGAFKATCLKLMDEVAASGKTITITKRGRAVACLVPAQTARVARAGALAHTIEILGDIVSPQYAVTDRAAALDMRGVSLREKAAAYSAKKPRVGKAKK